MARRDPAGRDLKEEHSRQKGEGCAKNDGFFFSAEHRDVQRKWAKEGRGRRETAAAGTPAWSLGSTESKRTLTFSVRTV